MPKAVKLIGVLTIICVISALSLAYVHNEVTGPIITEREKEQSAGMLREIIPDADDFEIITDENENTLYFEIIKDGKVAYVAIPAESSGFGGPVRLIIVSDMEGIIAGVLVLGQSETPGYGDRIITEPEFLEQYKSLSLVDSDFIMGTDIDALAGATVTSEASNRAVRNAAQFFMLNFMEGMEEELLERERDEVFSMLEELRPDADDFGYELEGDEYLYFTVLTNGEIDAIALITEGQGLNGPVQILTLIDNDGIISNTKVASQVDTPGYGDRIIDEPEFMQQFHGKDLVNDSFEVGDTIDVLAGATVTSTGATEAIQNAAIKYSELFGDGSIENGVSVPEDVDDSELLEIIESRAENASDFIRNEVDKGIYYQLMRGSELIGFAFITSEKGMASDIEMLTITDLGGFILDLVVIDQNDTPGFGEKIIEEEWFLEQYIGMCLADSTFDIDGEIDVVAGSTITSTAANSAVIYAGEIYIEHAQEGVGQ
jgi:electron transport complex protein RnfG